MFERMFERMFENPCHWCLLSSNPYVEWFGLLFLFACVIALPIAIYKGAKDGLL